ncbi:MAG TPA: MarR family transcriptional regulator [Acidimicrobiales bacterium]|nr:MarR family transcriptional regulator [Acidimicrobiales bacterium]
MERTRTIDQADQADQADQEGQEGQEGQADQEDQIDQANQDAAGAAQVADTDRAADQADDDDEVAARLRVAVTRLNRRLRQESLAGLSPAQASALGTVKRLGSPTLGELAVTEQVQPPTVTRLVGSLEAAGLVAREVDPGDRRVTRVRITSEGRRTLHRMRTLKNAFLTRRLGGLAPEEQEAAGALVALLEHLVAEP